MSAVFAERLAAILTSRRMTQRDLAQKTNLTEAAISRYISGAREPRAITVAKIAKALDVSTHELLGDETTGQVDSAVRLIARNANQLTEDQRAALISALSKR